MIKLIIISHPGLSVKHACGNHFLFLRHEKAYKNDSTIFISIHLPSQEMPEYRQKNALIFQVQKLSQGPSCK